MHVPGWHAATEKLQKEGKVQMLGIVQEQHPDRARLFMQWKQMSWPILVDSLNLLRVPAVPITIAIDEYGIVRLVGLPVRAAGRIEADFITRSFENPGSPPAAAQTQTRMPPKPKPQDPQERWSRYADWHFLWGGFRGIEAAIESYERVLERNPQDGVTHFRLGVAYRKRYDSPQRRLEDFAKAVAHWSAGLAIDPNQYIWRRRIQQYGPRLDKPYPFYNWVETARNEITARGEKPVPLEVEPLGAELARPSKEFTSGEATPEPDPKGRIYRDRGEFIKVETVVVPDTTAPIISARIHIVFRPDRKRKAHWNNEVDGLVFWLGMPDGWQADPALAKHSNPPEDVSQETRNIEFEVKGPPRHEARSVVLTGYALYYVCEDVRGVCMYRRQDISIPIPVQR